MPKLLQISNFAKAGLNSDLMPWDLPPDYLTEIRNVRISNQKLTPFGGSTKWVDLPVDFNVGLLMHVGARLGSYWLLAGLTTVQVFDGTTFYDISHPDGYGTIIDEDLWTGCMVSEVPVINHPNNYPQYWPQQNPAIALEYLPWDATQTWEDVNETCRIMRSHKQFLFALDLQSGSTEIADGVRWSSPADIGGVPDNWDPLDTTSTAGLVNLGAAGGRIIDGLSLRDAFVVYREGSIHVFDYIGGPFVWQIRTLESTRGLLSKNCIVESKGKHYLLSDGDVLVNDGNSIRSLMHNRLRQRFVSSIDPENFANAYAVKNNITNEIWFCVPQEGSTYADLAYIYNYRDDTWSIRDIPASPDVSFGPQSIPALKWEDYNNAWTQAASPWSQRSFTPLDETLVAVTKPAGVGQSGTLRFVDVTSASSDDKFQTIIERTDFPLEGLDKVTTITRVYPHCTGPGSFLIQVGSQDFPGAAVRWKSPVEFTPNTDRKVDIRTTGELHCFKFYNNEAGDFFEISGIDVEYVVSGKR